MKYSFNLVLFFSVCLLMLNGCSTLNTKSVIHSNQVCFYYQNIDGHYYRNLQSGGLLKNKNRVFQIYFGQGISGKIEIFNAKNMLWSGTLIKEDETTLIGREFRYGKMNKIITVCQDERKNCATIYSNRNYPFISLQKKDCDDLNFDCLWESYYSINIPGRNPNSH